MSKIEDFWKDYIASLPEGTERPEKYEAWSFGNTAKLANELGKLVKAGIKTATCGLLWEYEAEDEKLPQTGDLSIITNAAGEPLCIIETTEVAVRPFNEVDAQFAYDEGEGDRSLEYWREVHWEVFSTTCSVIGREPREDMPLVCERFRVLFSA